MFNPTFRAEVKVAESGDAEEEMHTRWMEGRVGRGKSKTRTRAKSMTVDRNNYWRSMGTFPDKDKFELTLKIMTLFNRIRSLELSGGAENMRELADTLVSFRDDMYDLQYWAVHQGDPSPILSDEERTGFEQLGILISESEGLLHLKMTGSLSDAQEERHTLLNNEVIPAHTREVELMRLESILQLIAEDEAMQLRYAQRVDKAKKTNKRRVDGESAGFAELQRITATDRKKAAARAKAYVIYRTLLFRRQIIQQFVVELREDIQGSTVDREDADAISELAKQRGLLAQLEAKIKAIIEPQRKARVASSAPRLRIEARTKARLGPRRVRKRVEAEAQKASFHLNQERSH